MRAAEGQAIALTTPLEEGWARQAITGHCTGRSQACASVLPSVARCVCRCPWPGRRVGAAGGDHGSGIAVAFSDAGLDVTLVEVDEPQALAAERRVRAIYDRQLHGGRLTGRLHAERTGRIRYATDLQSLRDSDLVIEAVVEDLAAKRSVFRALSGVVRRDAVLASNTHTWISTRWTRWRPERVSGCTPPARHAPGGIVRRRARRAIAPRSPRFGVAQTAVLAGVSDGFTATVSWGSRAQQCEYAL